MLMLNATIYGPAIVIGVAGFGTLPALGVKVRDPFRTGRAYISRAGSALGVVAVLIGDFIRSFSRKSGHKPCLLKGNTCLSLYLV
jgi:hypothetical protein